MTMDTDVHDTIFLKYMRVPSWLVRITTATGRPVPPEVYFYFNKACIVSQNGEGKFIVNSLSKSKGVMLKSKGFDIDKHRVIEQGCGILIGN